MATKSDFSFDAKLLEQGLDALSGKSMAAVRMYVESAAVKLESYMKSHRAWTDRTGMAKARLTAKSQEVFGGFRIVLAHGVSYGLWLELANEKRYAIIQPTILSQSSEVMEGFKNLMDKMK